MYVLNIAGGIIQFDTVIHVVSSIRMSSSRSVIGSSSPQQGLGKESHQVYLS